MKKAYFPFWIVSYFHNGTEASGVSRDGHYQVSMTQKGVELSWIILEMMKSIQISLSGVYFCLFDLIFALEKYVKSLLSFSKTEKYESESEV